MKILKLVGLGLAGLIALLAVVGLFLPRQWQVEQTVTVTAKPEHVFPRVADLKRWPEWAAWNKEMDPKVVWSYSGPESGVGAGWKWDGPVMGKGAMTITQADPAKGVWVDELIESDEVNAKGSVTWTSNGDQLTLVWKDEGTLPPVIGGYFKGMIETMLADHFSKGLAKLGALAEADTKAATAAPAMAAPTP